MSADRELLELAAKAAGIVVLRSRLNDPACQDMLINDSVRNPHQISGQWNPLTDDGDALRLAVKLHLHIHVDNGYGTAVRRPDQIWHACEAHKYGGLEAATRRAIVRAAAEIGKVMP